MAQPPSRGEPQAGKPNIPVVAELIDLDRLKRYPFLSKVSDTVLRKLQPGFSEGRFAAGGTILKAGGYTDAAYYLTSGIVSVHLSPVDPHAVAPPSAARSNGGFGDRVKEVMKRDPARQAVQQGGIRPDQTVMLADLPVDVRSREE